MFTNEIENVETEIEGKMDNFINEYITVYYDIILYYIILYYVMLYYYCSCYMIMHVNWCNAAYDFIPQIILILFVNAGTTAAASLTRK